MIRQCIADRFIPNRSQQTQSLSVDKFQSISTNYSKIISPQKCRYLKFSCKSADKSETMSQFIHKSLKKKKSQIYKYSSIKAYKILDAPEVIDNFYYNPLDCGKNDILGIALNHSAYLINPSSQIIEIQRASLIPISCLKFMCEGELCILGEDTGRVEIFDSQKNVRIRTLKNHYNRIGSLCEKQNGLFFSGSKDKIIKFNDLRLKKADVFSLEKHKGQICGLSLINNYLASGGNDNKVIIWDIRKSRPIVQLKQHSSAVKALAWCPWKTNILASGGGYKDGKINIWNGNTQKLQNSIQTQCQISSLIWSQKNRYLLSSCTGAKGTQGIIWQTNSFSKRLRMKGHGGRIIGMSMNKNEKQIYTIGSDETLRFWDLGDNFMHKQEQKINNAFTLSYNFR